MDTLLAVLVIIICASPFLWFICEVIFAPEGYEDDEGFHYGEEKNGRRNERLHDWERDIHPSRW